MYGDTSTFYFHNAGRPPPPRTVLRTLKVPVGQVPPGEPAAVLDLSTLAGTHMAARVFERHFSGDAPGGVFRARPSDPSASASLLGSLPRRLRPDQAAACEGPLGNSSVTVPELVAAARSAKRGKSPGGDGLPYEVYVAFGDLLFPVYAAVCNAALQCGAADASAPLAPLLEGVITLVPKPGKPADEVVGYSPITLLNADVKLLAAVVAARLHVPLDLVIDAMQAAFVKGRDISENVLFYLGLAEYLAEVNHPAWLMLGDLAQAYDSVTHPYLLDCLRAMGFREDGHVRWARLLHSGMSAVVLVNGWRSEPFPVRGSLAQGSGASPLYWTVVLQPLMAYINSLAASGRIGGVPLPGGDLAPPVGAFADDTVVVLRDVDRDGPEVKAAFGLFESASGVALSVPKTSLVPLGPAGAGLQPATGDPAVHAPTGFRVPAKDSPPTLLGVLFTTDAAAAGHAAF